MCCSENLTFRVSFACIDSSVARGLTEAVVRHWLKYFGLPGTWSTVEQLIHHPDIMVMRLVAGDGDRLLVYLTHFISLCLRRLESAKSTLRSAGGTRTLTVPVLSSLSEQLSVYRSLRFY